MTINSMIEARDAYDKMSPEQQAAARDAVSKGANRIDAVNRIDELARSQRKQNVAFDKVDSANDLREPTFGEKASSFAQGLADTLGMGAASTVKGITAAQGGVVPTIIKGAIAGPFAPIVEAVDVARNKDAFDKAKAEQDTAQKDADEQAPAAAGAGHLTGDVVNSALAAAAPLKSAAEAVEDIAAGAKPLSVLKTGLEGAPGVVGSAAKAIATKLESLSPSARAALAVGTAGKSEAVGAVARMLAKLAPATTVGNVPELVTEDLAGMLDRLKTPEPMEAAASPPPKIDKTDLKQMLADLKNPSATSTKAPNFAAAAEGFDPGGEDWNSFVSGKAPPAPARPQLDEAAKVLGTGTKVDRTPASMRQMAQDIVATPLPDEDMHAIAAERLASEAPTHAGDPSLAELRANDDDPELREAARKIIESEIAKSTWKPRAGWAR